MSLISQRCTPPLTGTALGGTAALMLSHSHLNF